MNNKPPYFELEDRPPDSATLRLWEIDPQDLEYVEPTPEEEYLIDLIEWVKA